MLAAIVLGVGYFVYSGQSVTEAVDSVTETVTEVAPVEAVTEAAEGVAEAVEGAVDAATETATDAATAVTEAAEATTEAATDAMTGMGELLTPEGFNFEKVAEMIDGSDKIGTMQKGLLKKGLEAAKDNPDALKEILTKVKEEMGM